MRFKVLCFYSSLGSYAYPHLHDGEALGALCEDSDINNESVGDLSLPLNHVNEISVFLFQCIQQMIE